jgi:hypothetical protein
MSGTISSSKMRSRDGWVNIKEIPHLRVTPSSESDLNNTRIKLESSIVFDDATSSRRREEIREDESNIRLRGSRDIFDRIDVSETVVEVGSLGEVAFEVEMSVGSHSKDTIELASSRSSLDFSLSKFSSGSAYENIKAAYDNFKSFSRKTEDTDSTCRGNLYRHTDGQSYDLDVSKSSEVTESSQLSKRTKPLFIDVHTDEKLPTFRVKNDIRDDTPKANNRSSPPENNFSASSKFSFKARKKEGVEKTLATVVQQIESSDDQSSTSEAAGNTRPQHLLKIEEVAPTVPENEYRKNQEAEARLKNEFSHPLSPSTHPSLKDSPLEVGARSKNLSENFLANKPNISDAEIRISSSENSSRLSSPSTHPSHEDSSLEVDTGWNNLSEKLLQDERNVVDAQLCLNSSSSSDADGRWKQMREKLLSVDSVTSPRSNTSLSGAFEDDLIQDCIETGLPTPTSPRKTMFSSPNTSPRKRHSRIPSFAQKVEKASEVLSKAVDQDIKQRNENGQPTSTDLIPSKPSTTKPSDKTESSNRFANNESTEEKKWHDEHHNQCLQDAKIDTVSSGLTAEGYYDSRESDQIQTAFSSFSEIEDSCDQDDGQILANFSSFGESQADFKAETGPLLKGVLSSGSESSHKSCDSGKQETTGASLMPSSDETNDQQGKPKIIQTASPDETNDKQEPTVAIPTPSDEKNDKQKTVVAIPTPSADETSSKSVTQIAVSGTKNLMMPKNPSQCSEESIRFPRIEITLVSSTSEHFKSEASDSSDSKGSGVQKMQSSSGREDSRGVDDSIEAVESPDASLFNDGTETVTTTSTESHQRKHSTDSQICNAFPAEEFPDDEISDSKNRGQKAHSTTEQVLVSSAESSTPLSKSSKDRIAVPIDTDAEPPASENPEHESPKVIITGRRKALLKDYGDNQSEKSRSGESMAEIIDVASTLTGSSSLTHRRSPETTQIASTPVLRKSSKQNNQDIDCDDSDELSVGFKATRSFDTKLTASSAGVPSWRMEPSESLADFAIEILNPVTQENHTYHVHKHILAIGPRKSEHLETIFRSNTLSSTRIPFEQNAADLFPHLLDFIYCHDCELHVTAKTAAAYRHLAIVFKVVPILVQVAEFILEDMHISNLSTYISKTAHYDDHKMMKLITAKCAEEIEEISISDPLWTVMEPDLFLRVLSCPRIDRGKQSSHLSVIVVEYQTLHKYEMNEKMFGMVTSEEIIPIIDRQAALPLLEICAEYGSPPEYQPLQRRCAHVMACYWKITSEADRHCLFSLLRGLPSAFTVDFLETVEIGKSATMINALKASKLSYSETSRISDFGSVASFSIGSLCDDLAGKDGNAGSGDESSLSWRMEPDFSFSDWTIKVKHRKYGHKEHSVDNYHVHKRILSIGPYKSSFFADIFLSGDQAHTRRGTTSIELAEEPASLVPQMLDFIYSPENHLDVSTNTAVVLRFLARVFGAWMLNKRVLEFVHKDILLSNVQMYLGQSETYDDETIVGIAARLCAQDIRSIEIESPLLHGFKPEFFGRVVSSSEIDKSATCHVTVLIAKYFTLHDLDESLLAELLKQSQITDIDCTTALNLLQVMSSLKSKEIEVFSGLRKQCATVLTENWSDLREDSRELMFVVFRKLDSSLLADIFDAVESDYYGQHYQTMTLQCKLVKRYRAQLSDAKTRREEEVGQLKKEMEETTAEMMAKNKDLEAKLAFHTEANNRRAMRSSGVYRSYIPSPRKSGIPSPTTRKSMTVIPHQGAQSSAFQKPSSEPKKSQLAGESFEIISRIPKPSPLSTKMEMEPNEETSSFFGRMFTFSTPTSGKTTGKLPTAQNYRMKLANSWAH